MSTAAVYIAWMQCVPSIAVDMRQTICALEHTCYFNSDRCVQFYYLYVVTIISGPGHFTINSVTTAANVSNIIVTYEQVSHTTVRITLMMQ